MDETRTEETGMWIEAWISAVAPDVEFAAVSASDPGGEGRIEIRLVRITPQSLPCDGRGTRKIWLEHLVTARLSDPLREQALLTELMFAAMERPEFELQPHACEIQSSFGLDGGPAILVRTALVREGERPRRPLVRTPLEVVASDMQAFEGVVTGPGDQPIAGACVESAGCASARTDAHGRFRLLGSATGRGPLRVKVKAKGVVAEASIGPGKPVVVQLPVEI